MPELPELIKPMQERISFFYDRASILPSNKFLIGFYGEYVNEAILKMVRDSQFNSNSSTNKVFFGDSRIYKSHLVKFITDHVTPSRNEVELKWSAKNITIPTVQSDIIEDISIDAIKTINYPLIKGHNPTGVIKIDIVENRTMTMYHFFNALTNRFFNPKILKPRSSFQKLGMYLIVLNQDVLNPTEINTVSGRPLNVKDIPVQVFEFNSIVPVGMSDVTLSTDMPAKKLEYSITFKAPNLFQSSFKTINEFQGLRDNTTDKIFKKIEQIGIDSGGMDKNRSGYLLQKSSSPDDPLFVFEVKNNDAGLKSAANGSSTFRQVVIGQDD